MAGEIPSYVETVMREFREVRLEWLRRSRFPLPGPLSPIVISVVKNEADRLEDFLRYYRNHGIERFVFVDNGSTDGGLEFLLAQPDVDVCERLGKFDWMLKQGWINKVVETYGYGRWYIYVDADEQIVFDGCETRTFTDLTVQMERQGLSRVRGFLVDMYSEAPLMQTEYAPGQPLIEAFAWFDHDTYKEERYKEIMSVKGGPRQRAFGGKQNEKFRPELTKYPLFKIQPGQYMANPHHIWPYKATLNPRDIWAYCISSSCRDCWTALRRSGRKIIGTAATSISVISRCSKESRGFRFIATTATSLNLPISLFH